MNITEENLKLESSGRKGILTQVQEKMEKTKKKKETKKKRDSKDVEQTEEGTNYRAKLARLFQKNRPLHLN